MSLLQHKRRRRPEMNLLPLIDVLVMLIFFAFVTMQFRSATTLNISVPQVNTADKNEFAGKITIGVDKEGVVTLNGQKVSKEQLIKLLEEVKKVNKDTAVLFL